VSNLARRYWFVFLATIIVIAVWLAGSGNKLTREAQTTPSLSPLFLPSQQPTVQPTILPTARPTVTPTVQPTVSPTIRPMPTLPLLGPLILTPLAPGAGPVYIPLKLRIPSLKVDAPMLGVGLTSGNVMAAPKGPIDDPLWHTAFWFRGGGIPGDVGTATIAGHVNNPLGKPEIFAHLQDLHPGDLIIIHSSTLKLDIIFTVDQVKVYSVEDAYNPKVLARIYGAGPIKGIGPQPASDGLSHLTLITCAGNIVNGQFDHRTVVYATRTK
jgi:hypothetical protein